ncbi:MAG: YdeI/OmpD-associated family protein [Cyclobacteriaceae bacterium]
MGKVNPQAGELINTYISKSSEFAKPILEELRRMINSCDDRIVEDWKWGAPNFAFKGVFCWTAAFQEHVGVNFYKGALIKDRFNLLEHEGAAEKSNRILKIRALGEINENAMRDYVQQCVHFNEKEMNPIIPKKETSIPSSLLQALKSNKKAFENFDKFPNSYKKEYAEWINNAKQETTRDRRINQALEWIEEGKDKNWKYK